MSYFLFVYSFLADCIIFLICLLNIDVFIIQQVYDGCCKTWNDLYLCERIIYLTKIALYEAQFNLNILLVSVSSSFCFASVVYHWHQFEEHILCMKTIFIAFLFRMHSFLFQKNCFFIRDALSFFIQLIFFLLEKHEKH